VETYRDIGVPMRKAPVRLSQRSQAWLRHEDQWTRSCDVMRRAETLVGKRASKDASREVSEGALRKSERQKRMPFVNNEGNGRGYKSSRAEHGNRPSASAIAVNQYAVIVLCK